MNLTQQIVDAAKARGYTLRAKGLYEKRPPNEIFHGAHRKDEVIAKNLWQGSYNKTAYATHEMVKEWFK